MTSYLSDWNFAARKLGRSRDLKSEGLVFITRLTWSKRSVEGAILMLLSSFFLVKISVPKYFKKAAIKL